MTDSLSIGGAPVTVGGETIDLSATAHRYWRLLGVTPVPANASSGFGCCLLDFRDGSNASLVPSGAAGAICGSVGSGSWSLAAAFNGSSSPGNGWYSGDTSSGHVYAGGWVGYDFGAPVLVRKVQAAPLSNYNWTLGEQIAVQWSDDGETWGTAGLWSPTYPGADGVVQSYAVPGVVAAVHVAAQAAFMVMVQPGLRVSSQTAAVALLQAVVQVAAQSASLAMFPVPAPPPPRRRQYVLM